MLARTESIRAASKTDAAAMTKLINIAGEGLPLHFWGMLASRDGDPWIVGEARARRSEGSFSWRNAHVADVDGKVAALLITYAIGHQPEVIDYDDTPDVFVPLIELENLALDTQYVNVLATHEQHRGKGYGSTLLDRARDIAGTKPLSIIVSDANDNAMRLYRAHGYCPIAKRAIVKTADWHCQGQDWVLMKT